MKTYRIQKPRCWVLRWHTGEAEYLALHYDGRELYPTFHPPAALEHDSAEAARATRDRREATRGCTAENALRNGVHGGHFWRIVRRGPVAKGAAKS